VSFALAPDRLGLSIFKWRTRPAPFRDSLSEVLAWPIVFGRLRWGLVRSPLTELPDDLIGKR